MTSQLSVQVTRGGLLESNHNIQAIFLDKNRKVIFNQRSSRRVFPRSAIKILQAIPFIQSKAIDQFNLTAKHVALSCCLLYTSPSPRDKRQSRMPSSA